jgi:hypothetical protein
MRRAASAGLDVAPAPLAKAVKWEIGHQWPTSLPSSLIDKAMVGDRKDPSAELVFVAPERPEPTEDVQEHVARHVLRLRRPLSAEIARHDWRQLPPEALQRPWRADKGGRHDVVKRLAKPHQLILGRPMAHPSAVRACRRRKRRCTPKGYGPRQRHAATGGSYIGRSGND